MHPAADIDEEGAGFLIDVRSLKSRHGAVCILHHEEQIEDSNGAVIYELQDRWGDSPGELVARKANDVDVDGTDCHNLSLLGGLKNTRAGAAASILPIG